MAENIKQSITELVGHTPLLRLNNLEEQLNLKAELIVKLEYYNPNQSIKDRIALSMIEKAEREGHLKKGDTVIETTSGNTGIGISAIASAKGYKSRIYVQDNVSEERFKVIHAFGGETIKVFQLPEIQKVVEETGGDFVAMMEAIKELIKDEKNVYFVNQLDNVANPQIHEQTTGPEIWEDTDGKIDYLVACVGTGGTISGTGKYLKSQDPNVKVVAVQPTKESLSTADNPVEEITGVHPFEGVPEQFIPANLDRNIYDDYAEVSTQQAFETARAVAKSDGILVGTSSGASIYEGIQLAKRPENEGKRIVVIAPDTGLRYLSTPLFED
jgi:cysteine synthase A